MAQRPLLSGVEKIAFSATFILLSYYAMNRYSKPPSLDEQAMITTESLQDRLKKTKNKLKTYTTDDEKRAVATASVIENIKDKVANVSIKKQIKQEENVESLMEWGLTEEEARFYAKLQRKYGADQEEEHSEADWLSVLEANGKNYEKVKDILEEN